MNSDFSCLVDPMDGTPLTLVDSALASDSGRRYPIVSGIPRFVDPSNYSDDFGQQWNRFPRTQLDSFTGLNISESRLARCLGSGLEALRGKMVLEAGSGAGRFTEILLKHNARVHSFDFSQAVEANARNNGSNDNLTLVQADIRHMPFRRRSYDCVMCLGVLQHTPSPEHSISCLWEMVRPGGIIIVDHYVWAWAHIMPPPVGSAEIVYRAILLRMPKRHRFQLVKAITDFWFPIHWAFKNSRLMQRILRRMSPVHFYYPHLPLRDRAMYYDWALLDTHDGTTDYYKHHRTPAQIEATLQELGAIDIRVSTGGNGVEAFGRKRG